MNSKQFELLSFNWWNKYYKSIYTSQKSGFYNLNGYDLLYPNIMITTDCNDYFIVEFTGASKTFNGLKKKESKKVNIHNYFSQFDVVSGEPLFVMGTKNVCLSNLVLSQNVEIEQAKKRFPGLELIGTVLMNTCESHNSTGSVFQFNDEFVSCCLDNCMIVNKAELSIRTKHIISAFIFSKDATEEDIVEMFNYSVKQYTKGIQIAVNEWSKKLILASQFQNIYLWPGLHETTIGEFLDKNREIIYEALKTNELVYEPYLKWIEKDQACEDDAINPDMLILRDDGYYDILDLKTIEKSKRKLTAGERKRRRPASSVMTGIAQLANYKEYFDYDKNCSFAMEKYKIKVNLPKLILIIGSWENVNKVELEEATRMFNDVIVIDYDTLCHLYLGANTSTNLQAPTI